MMLYTTSITVRTERVHNMLVSAFEGGSNDWFHKATFLSGTPHKTPDLVWYGEESVFAGPVSFTVVFDDPDEPGIRGMKTITQDDLLKGLTIMANNYPGHFADMLADNDDAETGDVFLQCVVLGDVVYG
jgi:hypothetical protein